MDIGCLIIRHGQHKILIDTGCGDSFQPSTGKLIAQLEKEGIKPAEIDTVIYTHGHTDHVGGTVDAQGKLMFPNARQIVSKREWDSWVDRTETTRNGRMFDLAVKNLLPIPDQFDLVEDDAEVERGNQTPVGARAYTGKCDYRDIFRQRQIIVHWRPDSQ